MPSFAILNGPFCPPLPLPHISYPLVHGTQKSQWVAPVRSGGRCCISDRLQGLSSGPPTSFKPQTCEQGLFCPLRGKSTPHTHTLTSTPILSTPYYTVSDSVPQICSSTLPTCPPFHFHLPILFPTLSRIFLPLSFTPHFLTTPPPAFFVGLAKVLELALVLGTFCTNQC